ncbi:MAG: hypothetical protein MR782_02325 [Campylobacter sp.]|nr:hypothetical protein [Campylobacter sp.]
MKIYLPLNQNSLIDYIKTGLIKPYCLYGGLGSNDTQAILGKNHYILLLKTKEKMPKNADFLIELEIEQNDSNLIDCMEYFLYKFVLPITKITGIYSNSDELNKSYTNREQNRQKDDWGNDFISKDWFKTGNFEYCDIDLKEIQEYTFKQDILDKIIQFDKLLGAFAFSRFSNEGKYYSYVWAELSHINPEVDYKANYENVDLKEEIISDDILKSVFKFSGGIYDLNPNENKKIFYSALVKNDARHGDKDVFVAMEKIQQLISSEDQFYVLFKYGYFKGYTHFSNRYYEKIIKFKMDEKNDILILDSVFKYIFELENKETSDNGFDKVLAFFGPFGEFIKNIDEKIEQLKSQILEFQETNNNLKNAFAAQKVELQKRQDEFNEKIQTLSNEKDEKIEQLKSQILEFQNNSKVQKKTKTNNIKSKNNLEEEKIDKPKKRTNSKQKLDKDSLFD